MAVDWGKYGVEDKKKKKEKSSRVEWNKYEESSPNPINVARASTIMEDQFVNTFSNNTARMAKEQTPKPVTKVEKVEKDSFLDKTFDVVKNVGKGLTDFKTKFEDSTSFGLSPWIDKKIIESGIMPDKFNQDQTNRMERAESSVGGKIGEFAGYIAPGAAIDKAVVKLGGKALEKLSPVVGGLIRGSAAGGIDTALQETGDVVFRGGEFDPLNVALGTGAGGVLGGLIPLVGAGARKIMDKYRPTKESPTLALPEPKQRGNVNRAITDDVITPEHTFKLDKPSDNLVAQAKNMEEARIDLSTLDEEIRVLNIKQSEAVNDQFKLLSEQLKNRQGVVPKGVIQDADGNVLGNTKGYSKNPEWYQEFYAQYGKAPNRRELYAIAKKQVDEGYLDGGTQIPSWKAQNQYDETIEALTGVRNEISRTLAERTNNMTDATLKSDVMKIKQPVKGAEKVETPKAELPKVMRDTEIRKQEPVKESIESEIAKLDESLLAVRTSRNRLAAEGKMRRKDADLEIKLMTKSINRAKKDLTDGIPNDVFPETMTAEGVKQGLFERLFGTQGVGITPQIADGRRNILSTEGQIVDKPIKQTITGIVDTTKAAVRRAYQNVFDELDPIKKISREAYDASMDANRSNQLANVIVTDKFVDAQGKVMGEGLRGIVRKSGRGNYNAFTDYLIARHAVTRSARGEAVYDTKLNMTTEKIKDRAEYLEKMYPGFKEIGEEWDGYFNNIRQVFGVEEGLIPKSLADALKKENPNYAPMKRQFTTQEKIKGLRSGGTKAMFSGQKAPLQSVSPVGSTRKVVDPVRSTIEQTGAWVNAAMRNRTMTKIVDAISSDLDGMKDIAEIIQPPKGQWNLRDVLETEGEERFLELLQEDFNKLFSKSALDEDDVVRAMVKGEPVYMRIHDVEAVKALSSMGSEQAGITLAIFRAISNTVKRGATGALAPVFAAKSVSVDFLSALIQSENPIKHSGYLVGSVFSSIGDVFKIPGLRNMAQDFYQAGGGYSAALRGERGLKKGVNSMRLDPLLSPRTIAKGVGRAIASPFKASIGIADISENLNRIAAFNYKIRQLGERTPDNVEKAMNYAREITTNYSRKGKWARSLEAVFPYQNAAVQGLRRFGKAWQDNPVKTAAMVGTLVILPKLYEYSKFADDKDYQDLPARERYRNFIIGKNEDGTFQKVPAPPEYAAIGALMVDMLRAHKDGDPEAFKGMSDAVMNAYTPPAISGALQGVTQGGGIEQSLAGSVTSTSIGPVLGTFANQSFTGGTIESRKVEDRSPGKRYDERTSKIAKVLGDKLNYSPMKIDYLLRSYGGDPARLGLPLTSDVGAGTVRNTLARAWIVDPVFTNTLTDDYYRGKEALSQAHRDNEEVETEFPEWYSEGLRKEITSSSKGSLTKRISLLTEEKKNLSTNKILTAEKKAQEIREIQRKINELYITANSKMKDAGVPILNR